MEHDTYARRDMKVTCAGILAVAGRSSGVGSGKMWGVTSEDGTGAVPPTGDGTASTTGAQADAASHQHDTEATTTHSPALEQRVLAELLSIRKTTEGLSTTSITACPVVVDLLGDGDPLMAFNRLEHRVLETLELGDDVLPLQAAVYSLGLATEAKTHLDRLNDFGTEYGYEARQARRHSDRGLQQLAALITSNWVVHTSPTVEVFIAEQSDRSLALTARTKHQWFVEMGTPTLQWQDADGTRRPIPQAVFVEDHRGGTSAQPSSAPETGDGNSDDDQPPHSAWLTTALRRPVRMPAPSVGQPSSLRVTWSGEVWPRFSVTLAGGFHRDTVLTSQTLGNTLVVTVEWAEGAGE